MLSIQVNAVRLGRDDNLARLRFFSEAIRLVQVVNTIEAAHLRLAHVSYIEVGMQRLFEPQRRSSGIGHDQFKRQLSSKRRAVNQAKVSRPPFTSIVAAFGEHADRDPHVTLSDGFKLPLFRAHKTVRRGMRIVGLVPEPGEAYGYAPANCAAILPKRMRAEEQDILRFARFP